MDKISMSVNVPGRQFNEAGAAFRPEFFRLNDLAQREKFDRILQRPGILINDNIREQVKELLKIRNPSKRYTAQELDPLISAHIGTDEAVYGVWVYYPWSGRVVHLLEKDDFIAVRTSRNQYKITPEERDILAQKKIGVIGLSVGQSVSVTLIMERICGEIRLADFDVLELTNLNRIRTGVHNLGQPKVYSVAREIAEIDPYIVVRCFPHGLTEQNMDDFFLKDGKLDLVVEESDGFDIKILCRYKARSLRVPVIMEASDRCMVDVERFDLEPDRPILHGIVKHLDVETLKTLSTNEEKIPYMLDVLGIDSTTARLRASMLEMQQSISTWPQLASAVTMGGGITADVSRRLLLGYYRSSGRYYVDVENIICDEPGRREPQPEAEPVFAVPDIRQLGRNLKDMPAKGTPLKKKDVEKLVAAGCMAPSAGNAQPWRWVYSNTTLYVFNPFAGDTSLLAFDNNAPYTAIGAAAMNVVLRAAEMGLNTELERFPLARPGEPVMSFNFTGGKTPSEHEIALAGAIETRMTNRKLGKRQAIPPEVLRELERSVNETDPLFQLRLYDTEAQLSEQGKLLGELEKTRLLDPAWHREFVQEIRWSEEENLATRDGIDLNTLDMSNTEKVGLLVARDPRVLSLISNWNGGGAFSAMARKAVDASGAVGMIVTRHRTPDMFLRGGMAMQRMWLNAACRNIALQPMGAPVFMFAPIMNNKSECFAPLTVERLTRLRPAFEKCFELGDQEIEVFIFRLAILPDLPVRSLRKPVEEVFLFKD